MQSVVIRKGKVARREEKKTTPSYKAASINYNNLSNWIYNISFLEMDV